MEIQTVTGLIDPESVGIIQPHEHLLIDGFRLSESYTYDNILYDESIAIDEVRSFEAAGGGCLVDVTPTDLGRNPEGLQRISQKTGVPIVMGCAWYRKGTYPEYVDQLSVNRLAERIIKEIRDGVGDTGVRPGIIGEIGTGKDFIAPSEERVFRAAARAHLETGAAITTHTTHFGSLALEQLDLLAEEGVEATRVIVGHLGDRRGIDHILPIAQRGAFISIDNIGWPYQEDDARIANIQTLISRGHLEQILLSLDICLASQLHWHGGVGYDYLLRAFVPKLSAAGVTNRQIEKMLRQNPQHALAFAAEG